MEPYALISSTLRWLYIDFNSYFASVEQQINPALRGKPVAVVPVETDYTSVIAASYEAKAYGIKTGTRVLDARRLCPELVCIRGDHRHYVDYHHRILAEIDRHIPVTQVCSIDEVACRLMDNENSLERSRDIALSIKAGLAQRVGVAIRCSIGVAPNRYLAKIATDMQKPDGLTYLGEHNLPDRLFALSLQDFPGIGRNMERRLKQAGLMSVQDLLAFSATGLRRAWGNVWGERMWFLLRGATLPEIETERRTVGHSHVLSPELRTPAQTRLVLRRLTLKAAGRLRRLDYFAAALHLSVRIEQGPRLSVERMHGLTQDSMTLLEMMEAGWSDLMQQARGWALDDARRLRFKKVSITLYRLQAADKRQVDLFEAQALSVNKQRKRRSDLSRAMDAINQKYGRDSILIGMVAAQGRGFTGTKVAFTRIPAMEEFSE